MAERRPAAAAEAKEKRKLFLECMGNPLVFALPPFFLSFILVPLPPSTKCIWDSAELPPRETSIHVLQLLQRRQRWS